MPGPTRRDETSGRGRRGTAASAALVVALATLVTTAPPAVAAPPALVGTYGATTLGPGDLRDPRAVAVGADGLVYVADIGADAVVVFDRDGAYQRHWPVTDPAAIAIAPGTGHVLTLRTSNCTVSEFDENGTAVQSFGACGTGSGLLSNPTGLAVADDGSVYVVDSGHDKVQQYSSTGTFIRTWGSSGTGDGQFRSPVAIARAPDGSIVVTDRTRDDVQVFTADGTFVRKWGTPGAGDGQFTDVSGVAVAPDGSVATVDLGTASAPPVVQRFAADGTFVARWGSRGAGAGELDAPRGVAVAPDSALFVVESANLRVQRFAPDGTPAARWGSYEVPGRVRAPRGVSVDGDGRVLVADEGSERVLVYAADGSPAGTWTQTDGPGGALLDPAETALDAGGDVLVVDRGHDWIQRYGPDGTPDGGWGGSGTGDGQFTDPIGIAVAPDGDVLVSDAGAKRVQQFESDGTFVRAWSTVTSGGATFTPGGLDLDATGEVFVANTGNQRVEVFTPTGTYLRRWAASDIDSLAVDRANDVVYTTNCSSRRITRTDLSGGAGLNLSVTACPVDLTAGGDDLVVAEPTTFPGARVERYAYPAGGGVDIRLSVDPGTPLVGSPLQYHVTLVNTGTVTLTGVALSSSVLPDCTRPVADLAPRATTVVDCSYVPVAADVGVFPATVTVDTDDTDPAASNTVSVQVNGASTASTVRQWHASPTGLPDGDPIGGSGLTTTPGIDVGPSGDVYVAGTRAYPAAARVMRFDRDGQFQDQFGEQGTGPGQLGRPNRVAVGPDGEVYVADCDNARIQRFTAAGTFDHGWDEERTPSSRTACSPADVDVAADGTAYVADAANDRIAVIDGATLTPGWGSTGTGDGQFNTPNGVAVAPDGSVYVLDGGNRRVQHFTAGGAFLGSFGSSGTALGQFSAPTAIDVDADGTVYVSDRGSGSTTRRTQVFTGDGRLLVSLPIVTTELAVGLDAGGSAHLYTYPYSSTSSSAPIGVVREIVVPAGPVAGVKLTADATQLTVGQAVNFTVRVDNLGTVPLTGVSVDAGGLTGCTTAVEDLAVGANRTVTCSTTATIDHVGRHHLQATVDTAETPPSPSTALAVQVLRPTIAHFGGAGTGEGQLQDPAGMTANWRGDLYVADCGNDRVVHYSTDGTALGTIGSSGPAIPGRFDCPVDVALNAAGNLLVLDQGHHNVQELQPDGTFVRWFDTRTTSPGLPWAVDVDESGTIYVADAESETYTYEEYFDGWGYTCCITVTHPPNGNNFVRRFAPDGTFLGEWGGYSDRYLLEGLWITGDDLFLVDGGRVRVNSSLGEEAASLTGASSVRDVAVDRFGHVWAAGGGHVRELTEGGQLLADYNVPGATGITVDRDNVYVTNGDRVTKIGIGPPLTALAGTVTDRSTGDPLGGAYVAALRASDLSFVRGAVADDSGFYRMDVPAGTYVLEFFDPTDRHRFEWYNNLVDPASLDLVTRVTVASSEEKRANAALDPTRGTFTGSISRSTNTPNATTWAIAMRNGTPVGMGTTTGNGTYTIPDLRAGDYTLVFFDPTGRARPEFYNDSPSPAGAISLAITGSGDSNSANASLTAVTAPNLVGTAAGTVTDGAAGDPLSGALIVAMRASDLGFVQATTTGVDGTWTLPLPAGEHYLQIVDATGAHVSEWYDDQSSPASFSSLTTAHLGGTYDAALRPTTGRIAGRVTETGGGAPIGDAWVVAYGPGGTVATTTSGDGRYAIEGLAPGTYNVIVVDPAGAHRPEYYEDRPGPDGAAPVPVPAATTATVDVGLDPN